MDKGSRKKKPNSFFAVVKRKQKKRRGLARCYSKSEKRNENE